MTDERAREKAQAEYGSDEIEFDLDARIIHLDEENTGVTGAAWVQAWVYVGTDEEQT